MSAQLVASRSGRCAFRRPAAQGAAFRAASRPVFVSTQQRRSFTVNATEGPQNAEEVIDDTFASVVLDSKIPVLVDFWAPWCGPCRMISGVIDELAVEYKGKVKCVKVNTDNCPAIATKYSIRSIPTVMIFKGGEKMESVIGAVPKASLQMTIDKHI